MKKLIAFVLGILFAGNLYAANLQSGYTELEYLEVATEGAYFSTGIDATVDTDMGITASNVTSASAQLLVAQCVSGGDYFRIAKASATQRIIGTLGSSPVTDNNADGVNKFTARINKSGFYVDGSLIGTFSDIPSSFTGIGAVDIFSGKYSNATYYAYAGTRFYSAWVDDNVFLPCRRNSDNQLGVYNTKTGEFILPSGSGTFTAGPDVDPCINLMDKNACTAGYYYAPESGEYTAADVAKLTDYIPVTAGTTYTAKLTNTGSSAGNARVNFFDTSKIWLSQTVNRVPGGASGYITIRPNVTGYIRISANYSSNSTFDYDTYMIVQGDYNSSNYPPYTPYNASCHTTANACNNLFDGGIYARGQWGNTGEWSTSYADKRIVGSLTPITPNTTYTMKINNTSDNVAFWNYAYFDANRNWLGNRTINGESQSFSGATEKTFTITDANARYFAPIVAIGNEGTANITDAMFRNAHIKIEEGSTATEYCTYRGKIKIATTKYNNTAFGPVVTALNNAVDTIKTVVSNTINQATAVANLHSGKQTKPTDTCPNGKICLLVEDDNGTPHWYEIIERAPGIVPAGSGYTQVEYLQTDGNQYIDTGITSDNVTQIKVNTKYRVNAISGGTTSYVFGSLDRSAAVLKDSAFGSLTSALSEQYYNNNYAFTASMSQLARADISLNTDYEYEIKYENQISSVTINNTTYTYTNDSATKSIPLSMYVFKGNDANNSNGFKGRIYYWKIELNGALVRDFVPARRNSDGVLGMYDTVSGNFFTNAGSGEFTAPGYLPASYTQLTYLQTDGNSWIDTSVMITGREHWTMDIGSLETGTMTKASAGSLSNGTTYTTPNNFSVTYLQTSQLAIYLDGNTAIIENAWRGDKNLLADKLMHHLEWFNLSTAPQVDGVDMTQATGGVAPIAVTPTIPVRLFGRADTGTGGLAQSGIAIGRFTGDTWDYVPVRRNSDGALGYYDLKDSNPATAFHTNKGTGEFTPGAPVQ